MFNLPVTYIILELTLLMEMCTEGPCFLSITINYFGVYSVLQTVMCVQSNKLKV